MQLFQGFFLLKRNSNIKQENRQDFRRAIPASSHVLSECRIGTLLILVGLLCERTSQAEVAELHVTLLVEQNVRGLLVPVDDIRRMKVLGCFEQLVHYVLLVNILEDRLTLYHVMQIGF